jgi:Fuseless
MKKKKKILQSKLYYLRTLVFNGLSFKRDETFIPNLVLCVGVVFVRRWLWNLIDLYFFPENQLVSNIVAIVIWIFCIYLPDHSFSQLWWLKSKESLEKSIAKEVSELLRK